MGDDNKTDLQSMHSSSAAIPCRLCGKNFTPKRRDQVFCSASCRLKYFEIARRVGMIAIENIKKDRAILELLIRGKKG